MKILLISLAGIGDTLLATSLLRVLREQFPSDTIDAFVRWPGAKDILAGNPYVNTVYQQNFLKHGAPANWKLLRQLRRQRYDVSINTYPQGRIEYRITARLINAAQRLSHRYERHSWIDNRLVNRTIEQDYEIHCIENNLNLLKLLGLTPPSRPVPNEVFLSAADQQWAKDFLAQHQLAGKTLLAVHVGSGKTKNLILKRWPVEHYVKLLDKVLQAHPQVMVLLFGGPEEREDNEKILAALRNKRVLPVPSRTMKQAVALLGRCQVFVSVDNVFMHLAATVKVPEQIVIESPTFNKTIHPYQRPFRLVPNPMVAGRNLEYYLYDGRDIQGTTEHLLACMRSISPEMVFAELKNALVIL